MILLSRLTEIWQNLIQGNSKFGTPAVTGTQQFALGQALIAVLVVLGFSLDEKTQQMVLGLSAVLAASLPASDALIRRKRSDNAEGIQAASANAAAAKAAAGGDSGPSGISAEERQELVEAVLRLRA